VAGAGGHGGHAGGDADQAGQAYVAVEVIPPGWNQLRRQEPLRRLAASRYDYL